MADQADAPISITVRFFAAARAAAGATEEKVVLTWPATVGDALAAVVEVHGRRLGEVLRRCSYLMNETAVHGLDTLITDGDVLDALPPFAGG